MRVGYIRTMTFTVRSVRVRDSEMEDTLGDRDRTDRTSNYYYAR